MSLPERRVSVAGQGFPGRGGRTCSGRRGVTMMGFKTRMSWAASMLVACFLSGCEHDTPPPPATPVESGAPEAPFDVQKIMERVHFAFRAEGSAWRGGHDTYAVRADALGLSVTPYHYPKSSAKRAELERGAAPAAVEGAPVHLGAARVSRGGVVLSGLAGDGRGGDTGGLRISRGEGGGGGWRAGGAWRADGSSARRPAACTSPRAPRAWACAMAMARGWTRAASAPPRPPPSTAT